MNTTDSFNFDQKSKNLKDLILKNWNNLDETQKSILNKIWRVITYKWRLQILFNLPFLIWWLADKTIVKVHEIDLKLLSFLNLPDWAISLLGFGKLSYSFFLSFQEILNKVLYNSLEINIDILYIC